MRTLGVRHCVDCKEVLPAERKNRRCRPCNSAEMRRYRQANPEQLNASRRAHYARNRDGLRAAARAVYALDREANNQRRYAQRKAQMKREPEHLRRVLADQRARRRARERNAPVVEKIDRLAIYERDGGICYLCDEAVSVSRFELDHVVPLSRGGEHSARNLKVACKSCNSGKRDKLLEEMAA
jgi:5-methylcytosine-specific restriction endonuclease McrA